MQFNPEYDWRLAGYCGVDAGLIMIGDPCYVIGPNPSNVMLEDWDTFIAWLHEEDPEFDPSDEPVNKQMPFRLGHDGAGVVFESGYGDGVYPVYIAIKDCDQWGKRIAEARIVFIDPEEDE